MVNPNFPCMNGECDKTLISGKLCADIGKTIITAGGAGYFEASPCSIEILAKIATEKNSATEMIRHNLGIAVTDSDSREDKY